MATVKVLDSFEMYTIGWLAALYIERAAAIAMLDERHDRPSGFVQHSTDTNVYTWGRMEEHNVVIASLPAGMYGTTSAATTALNMLSSLPHIRIGLLVGIGGGISRPQLGRDIRLGDIVVSQPEGTTGGVIQYDLGKAKSNQKWERKDFLGMPPRVLLQALASLQAEHELGESRLPEFLELMPQRKSRGSQAYKEWGHQGTENDNLFKSTYDHVSGRDCRNCNPSGLVERDERDTTHPEIHYGIIASGNTLVKDAVTRDKIAENVGDECICFEMEAAGLMNNFPCLVIRGICDYADSHKNDQWRRYASATAAAYGKELLGYIPTRDLQDTQRALDVLRSMDKNIRDIHAITSDTRLELESLQSNSHLKKIEIWISPPDTSTNLNEALKKRQKGTGSWFLQSNPFQDWETGTHCYLWLHGIPGCGKTVLSATIIEHLNQQLDSQLDSSCVVLQFFFDFTDAEKQTFDKLIRSLIAQLYSKCESSRKELDKLFSSCEDGRRQPTTESLCVVFMEMLDYTQRVQIVIDALDECKTRGDLLQWIENLSQSEHKELRLLATSRKEEDIESEINRWLVGRGIVSIRGDAVDRDIRSYVHERLRSDRGFERWRSQPAVQDEIETQLMQKTNGMFRWAACQLDILQKCLNLQMLRKALRGLPKTLEETYARILIGIDEAYRHYAIRILQFLTYSERPLTIQEAIDVMVVDPNEDPAFDATLRMPKPREIMRICSSLVSLITIWDAKAEKEVMELQLAHFSVQQYLKSDQIQATFPKVANEVGGIFQQGLDRMNARETITMTCLAYLSHLGELDTIEGFETTFPLARYAARYWMHHARLTRTKRGVQKRILNFLLQERQAYSTWLKIFNPDYPESNRPPRAKIAAPLYYTSSEGLQQTVRLLLENGADVNAQGGRWGNALQAASSRGHWEIAHLLIDKGAAVNALGGHLGNALQAAATEGLQQTVRLLLERGADINAQGGRWGNALQATAREGHLEIACLLLQKGADVNAQGGYLGNALQAASRGGHREVARLLLEKGADVNAQGGYWGNALQAALSGGHRGIARLLIERGADVNRQGGHLGNALQAASSRGCENIVRVLLERDADVNAQVGYLGNALQAASCEGNREIVRLLLERGANVNARGGNFGNALQAASCRGHREIVRVLLEKGADVNLQGGLYSNALQAASRAGHREIAKLLVEKGARVRPQVTVEQQDNQIYQPKQPRDIFETFSILQHCGRVTLPRHTILQILEFARYWLLSTVHRKEDISVVEHDCRGRTPYLTSEPIRGSGYTVREIVFDIWSHDQGWSCYPENHGTLEDSWTWFEIDIERSPDKDRIGSQGDRLATNLHAYKEFQRHHKVYGRAGSCENVSWIEMLQANDRVSIIPMARFPGWRNYVQEASIEVYSTCLLS